NDLDGGHFTSYEPVVVSGDTEGLKEELLRKDMFIADLKKELEEKKANDYAIAQALIIAQRSADEILNIAHGDAAQIRHDAELEAEDIINKANREKQDIIKEIVKLDDDREEARSEYQTILKDFISDASKKLSDLSMSSIPASSSHAKGIKGERVMPKNQTPIRSTMPAPVAYTTPQASTPAVIVPTTPKPSRIEKDLSGFGDAADSFEFGEID
ncbi:MAG: DivIVA domain-containing protein, partial [Eggerthellaceae bacterium]|nr:DivIVA domain-containing protein [Eggerthellaceae bacterium]